MTVVSAPLVVRGTVLSAEVYGRPRGDIDQTRIVVHVEEVLKGNPPDPLIFAAYEMTEDVPIRRRDVGHDMIFFLQPSKLGAAERRDCVGCESELVTSPSGTTAPQFIDLDHVQREPLWNADLQQLTDPKQILAAARSARNLSDSASFVVTLSDFQRIWIPDDGTLASRAIAWSKSDDPNQRLASVDVLASVDPEQGIPELRRLLDDPWLEPLENCERAVGPWTLRKYPIRAKAWRALQDRLQDVPQPRMGIDPGFYHPMPSLTFVWTIAALFLIAAIWSIRRFVRSWPARKAGGGWEWSTGLCAALIVAIAWTHFRALDVIDSRPGFNRSLTLVRGEIQYRNFTWSTTDQFAPIRKWICFRVNSLPTPWHAFAPAPMNNPAVDWHFAGFMNRQSGGVGSQSSYLAVPSWPLLAMVAGASSISLFRRIRSMRRAASGQCPSCGYDLRASSDCCPECGEAIAAVPGDSRARNVRLASIFLPGDS